MSVPPLAAEDGAGVAADAVRAGPAPVGAALADTALASTAELRQVLEAIDEVDEAERALRAALRVRLGLGATDLSVVLWIDGLERRGRSVRIGDLSTKFGVKSGAATEIANRLERRGVVGRRPDPDDGRGRQLHLTAGTRAHLAELVGEMRDDLDELIGALDGEERLRLVALLGRVRDILRTPTAR